MKKIGLFIYIALTSVLLAQQNYYINSLGNDTNSGTIISPWQTIGELMNHVFQPGDSILFHQGDTFTGDYAIILGSGLNNNPIVIDSYGNDNNPIISADIAGFIINGQSHIIIQNIEFADGLIGVLVKDDSWITPSSDIIIQHNIIHGSITSGINITDGSNNIYIMDNEIYNCATGLFLGSNENETPENPYDDYPIGCNNHIEANNIHDNSGNGIGISKGGLLSYDEAFHCENEQAIIRNNSINHNLQHGIELSGNYYIVENNYLFNNGSSGHSGIHIFDRWPYEGLNFERGGDYNIIRNNIVMSSNDHGDGSNDRTDGNGIQMDMWCDYNLIYNNICYENDGAGIIIFGASDNRVYNNTLFNNGHDLGWGGAIRFGQAEMVLITATTSIDEVDDFLLCENNIIRNNIGVAFTNYGEIGWQACEDGNCRYALITDDVSILESSNNIFSHNIWVNTSDDSKNIGIVENILNDGHFPSFEPSNTEWNSNYWVSNEMTEYPDFVDSTANDFHLKSTSIAINSGYNLAEVENDFDNYSRLVDNENDRGAYEYQTPEMLQESRPTIQNFYTYPNPFNPFITIQYQLKIDSKILLEVFNIKGQNIKTLVNLRQALGQHSVQWNPNTNQLESGLYFVRLTINELTQVQRILYLQ